MSKRWFPVPDFSDNLAAQEAEFSRAFQSMSFLRRVGFDEAAHTEKIKLLDAYQNIVRIGRR